MSSLRSKIYYYWKKLSEKRSRKQYDTVFFKEDLDRFKRSTNNKPQSQIKSEMNVLQDYWNCFPYQYYRFDLYRKDCSMQVQEMKNYVPLFFFNNLFFPLSFKNYGVLSSDKLLNFALLKAYDIPQPPFLFGFDNQSFYDGANSPIPDNEIDSLLANSNALKIFVKPRFGSEGKGIDVFKKEAAAYLNKQQQTLSAAYLLNHYKDGYYIVQEGLVQHAELNEIYAHSINTIRVITEFKNGQARVLFSVMRIGKGGNQVDNAAAGGVYVKIDPEGGAFGDVAYAHDRLTFDAQPDTNFRFKGASLKAWPQVKELALSVARKYREITYLGWDIALTESGPCVIELNSTPDMAMVQDCYGPLKADLKIEPEAYWHQEKFTIRNVFKEHN